MSCCIAASIAFSGAGLDRADHIRSDPDRLDALKSPQARLLKLDGLVPSLDDAGRLEWTGLHTVSPDAELVFLGLMGGVARFAAVPENGDADPAFAHRETWRAITIMSADDLAIYGCTRSLLDWHARHRFCAQCGAPSTLVKGGWQRNCVNENCGASHFPRVDPVSIMLVEHDGTLLMGRQARFPERRYSALAGFVEPGESIEDAVAREVQEEAGIKVRDVRYIFSQPWPFPSQLMLGCHAMADSPHLTIDETELEDARWFTREQVEDALSGQEDAAFLPPPKQAIARQLLEWWLEQ